MGSLCWIMSDELKGGFVDDMFLLAVTLLRQGLSLHNTAVLAYLFREGEAEAGDIVTACAMSKSNVYQRLAYLLEKGLVESYERKDFYRRRVQVWRLTDAGRRETVMQEMTYRRVLTAWRRTKRVQGGGAL